MYINYQIQTYHVKQTNKNDAATQNVIMGLLCNIDLFDFKSDLKA